MELRSNFTDFNVTFAQLNAAAEANETLKAAHDEPDIRKSVYPVLLPLVLTLCLVSFLLSIFVVCSSPFVKRPMSPTIRLSLSLSAANAAFAGVVFTGTVIHSYLPWVYEVTFPKCISVAVEALRLGVILVQVYHLLAVALIHYLGTLRPLQYAATLTPQFLKFVLFVLWTFPILGMFVGFTSVSGQGFQSKGCSNNHFREKGIHFRLLWSLIYFGPTVVLVIVYLHIFIILSRRGKNLEDSEHRRTIYRNMKTVKTTAMIVITFLIGWSPAVVAFLLICEDCYFQINDTGVSIAIFSTTYILFILKVFVDNFIYALRLPEIREALRVLCSTIFHCCFCTAVTNSRRGKFHVVTSKGTYSTRSTYLTSIKSSSSCNSHREKPLKKSLSSCELSKSYVAVEMKPLFEKA